MTDFTLINDPPRPPRPVGQNNPQCRQKVLLTGLDCLPGQLDLPLPDESPALPAWKTEMLQRVAKWRIAVIARMRKVCPTADIETRVSPIKPHKVEMVVRFPFGQCPAFPACVGLAHDVADDNRTAFDCDPEFGGFRARFEYMA